MASAPMLLHTFCRQISSVEFEEQRVAASHKAMEDLLEILLTDRSITDKDRQKRLKQARKGEGEGGVESRVLSLIT